jgi:hypothetical protein
VARAHVPELTYERLHPVVQWLRKSAFDLTEPPRQAGLLLLNNSNIPVPQSQIEPLTPDRVELLSRYNVRADVADPFVLYAERRLEAEIEARTNGRPRESVIQTGIAAEVLLGALLGLAMWEEHVAGQLTTEEAAAVLSDNVTSRIRSQYSKRFGGKWSFNEGLISRWQRDIATPRNRVVHAGVQPGKDQAHAAIDALSALERYIGDRLAVKWKTYPRTAWMFLGGAGFQRRGHNKLRAVEAWLSANGGNVVEWIRDYQGWREEVDAQVVRTR